MKKTIISFIAILYFGVGLVNAQKDYISINYAVSFGNGDLGDYISQTSFRGFLFEYKTSVSPTVFVGLDAAWNLFYEKKDYATYTKETLSVSGVQFRYSRNVPLLVSGEYLFRPDEAFRPYINFGLGTMYTKRTLDMGVYRLTEESWQFTLKPEVGFIYELNHKGGLKFGAKYYQAFEAGGMDAQSYFSLSFGYLFMW